MSYVQRRKEKFLAEVENDNCITQDGNTISVGGERFAIIGVKNSPNERGSWGLPVWRLKDGETLVVSVCNQFLSFDLKVKAVGRYAFQEGDIYQKSSHVGLIQLVEVL